MKISLFLLCFFLTSCGSYRMPMQGVERMSGDTLCYRAAYAKDDPSIAAEIKARNLNCEKYLGSDPSDH